MYQISTEQFSGPLALLLQLVEKRNLEITEISLAQVTQDYLLYISNQELVSPNELADFLVIASTLLLIKSKAILPSLELQPEEEEEIIDLEERLRLYKFYKFQGEKLRKLFQENVFCSPRPVKQYSQISFVPPANIDPSRLASLFNTLSQQLQEEIPAQREKKVINKIVTLQERIKYLIRQLTQKKNYSFQDLVAQKKQKIEVVVTFLALLYLIRENIVKVKQKNNFGTIWISSQK